MAVLLLTIAVVLVVAAAVSALQRHASRKHADNIREMRAAFAFLREHGMSDVREVDRGTGSILEYRGPDVWLDLYDFRGMYFWEFGLVDRPEHRFEPHEFCATAAEAELFASRSVRELGDNTRPRFARLLEDLRSDRGTEIVRQRDSK
jgi:hypothetical protein